MTTPLYPPADEAAPGADATASEVAIRLLRRDIVSGALEPDSKLKLRILKERYGIGGSHGLLLVERRIVKWRT